MGTKLSVIREETVKAFSFWFSNTIWQGICHGTDIYMLICAFACESEEQAYEFSCELAAKDIPVVITLGEDVKIWKSLKTQYWSQENREADLQLSVSP